MKTIYNLQVCRAIAAIMVLLEHESLIIDPGMLHGFLGIGWCGVDMFFVLSGFIIYYVNHKYIGVPAKFKQYIGRRLFRIYPIYWIYTIGVILIGVLLYHTRYDIDYISRSLLLYPFHTELNQYPIIPPAHTLVYEVIFYIIFGIGILTCRRIFIGTMLFWLSLIVLNMFSGIISIEWIVLKVALNPINIEFFYGCFIAWIIINKPLIISRTQAGVLLVAGICLLMASWLTQLNNYGPWLGYQYLKFGIPFAMIIYALAVMETGGIQSRIKKLFVKLGDASYSIYLIHYTGLSLLHQFFLARLHFLNSLSKLLVGLVIIAVISYYAYKWIEYPIVRYFNRKLK